MKRRGTLLRNILCALLFLTVILGAPTGWLYDLGAGEGTGQGQWPSQGVGRLERQEEIEAFFLAQTPATIATGGELTACPLARLRDAGQEGVHYHHNYGGRWGSYVSEYITAGYPISAGEKFLQSLAAGGFYNRYYLVRLEDGSHLCVYFDDYLLLAGGDRFPVGYVRYATNEERQMLGRLAEDYDADTAYILDMYRHGKVNWMLDLTLRLGVCLAAGVGVWTLAERRKKRAISTT